MHSSHRGPLTILALLTLAALPVLAKPSFNGDWKLIQAKSNFGGLPAPVAYELKISHEDPKLTVATKMTTKKGQADSLATYTTDGQECSNESLKSTLKWDGDTLIVDSKGQISGDTTVLDIQDKWTLGADGKTLSIDRRLSSKKGKLVQKLVLVKQ